MKNLAVARILQEMADMMDLQGIQFKPEAYRRAARAIEGLVASIEDYHREGRLESIPGVGKGIAERIDEFLTTGRITDHEKLKAKVPTGLSEVMRIPGVGPKTARLLHETLGITGVEELKNAAEDGKLLKVKGMGPKKAENILKGISILESTGGRVLLGFAYPMAEAVVAHLKEHAPVERIQIAGSLRRMRETIGDIDLVATSSDWNRVIGTFVNMPNVAEVVLEGPTKATIKLREGLQADLRVVDDEEYGAALQYFTGNKDHNIHLRTIAQRRGLKINEYGVFRGEDRLACRTEEEMYATLGMATPAPEMRWDEGEIEAAEAGTLPTPVALEDIMGDFHVHTNATDGHDSLEAMVQAARKRGYEYVGISDHSRSLSFINGLSVERLLAQRDRIRDLNRDLKGFRVFMGAEVDILPDGSLDYPDEVLKELNYVIASVHSRFTMEEKEMTQRVVAALENPYTTILGHPTCRLIGEREPVDLDFEEVVTRAVRTGTALEINAYTNRLDLNGSLARLARDRGAEFAIDTDSHATHHLALMRYGVGTARRGWVEAKDVINAHRIDAIGEYVR